MKRYLVERELIQNNIQVLQKKAGSAVIWAVLKGNGYGLGLLPIAETCRAAGLDHFAVTEIADARALREGGFETEPILMLQPTADADEITALLPAASQFLFPASNFNFRLIWGNSYSGILISQGLSQTSQHDPVGRMMLTAENGGMMNRAAWITGQPGVQRLFVKRQLIRLT